MSWLVDDAIRRIRRKGRLPDDTEDYPDDVICEEMDDFIASHIVPAIASLRDGQLVNVLDVTLVVGQSEYDIPLQSAGVALVDATWINTAGDERDLLKIDEVTTANYAPLVNADPQTFLLRDNGVVLYPPPSTASTLRLKYVRQRSRMVTTANAGRISSLVPDTGAGSRVVCFDDLPADFVVSQYYDVVSSFARQFVTGIGLPRRSGEVVNGGWFANVASGDEIGSTIVDVTENVQAGDYLCFYGESCVLQIPLELHAALYDGVAGMILLQTGYTQEGISALARASRTIERFQELATPRVKYASTKIINNHSPLRSKRMRRR